MMFCDFRRVFNPTREELIDRYEMLLKLHNNQLGKCSTCTHYVGSSAPGVVIDYGSCRKCMKFFSEKACGMREIECTEYDENLDNITKIKTELDKWKRKRLDCKGGLNG